MKDLKARIARRSLLFDKFHDVVMQERHAIVSGHIDRLSILGAKKQRIMKAVDSQPLGDISEEKQDAETGKPLVLLQEKVRAVIKESAENERMLKEQIDVIKTELHAMKKENRVRSAYHQSSPASSLFIDDKK